MAALLYHGLHGEEAARLMTGEMQERRGIQHFLKARGKCGKTRYLPLHPITIERIYPYLESDSQSDPGNGRPFRSVRGKSTSARVTDKEINKMVAQWARTLGIEIDRLGVHGVRATAPTNALEHDTDIAKVQVWLGHANISTTRLYDRHGLRPEDLPNYKVEY